MYLEIKDVEALGLEAFPSDWYNCRGCVFNSLKSYEGVRCSDVPCTPGRTGGEFVIWAKRENPEQG